MVSLTMQTVAFNLTHWRKSLSLSVPEAAELLGISKGRFYRFARASEVPKLVFLACAFITRYKGEQRS